MCVCVLVVVSGVGGGGGAGGSELLILNPKNIWYGFSYGGNDMDTIKSMHIRP